MRSGESTVTSVLYLLERVGPFAWAFQVLLPTPLRSMHRGTPGRIFSIIVTAATCWQYPVLENWEQCWHSKNPRSVHQGSFAE